MRVYFFVVKTKIFSKALLMFILAVSFLLGGDVFASCGDLVISEVMYNPDGSDTKSEWIEVFNNSSNPISLSKTSVTSQNLKEMKIKYDDVSNNKTHYISFLEEYQEIDAGEFFIIMNGDDTSKFGENIKVFKSSFSLSNETATIGIVCADENWNNFVNYAKEWGAGDNDKSLEKIDLDGTSAKENWQESFVVGGTPGTENSTKPLEEEKSGDDESCLADVILSEALPNPSGDETRNEYIEIRNNSDSPVDLGGWKLYDLVLKEKYDDGEDSGYEIPAGSAVKPDGYSIIYRDAFKFSLHNTQEEAVFLKDPCGNFISQTATFKGAKEDYSYSFDGEKWRWTSRLTPKGENKFDSIPQVEIIIDKKVFKDISASFEAVIVGKGKNSAKVDWDFGDDSGSTKKKTTHTYEEVGKYSASVKVSGAGEDFFKQFDISVEKFKYPEVRIVGINPNPPGKDTESESIIIKNKSKKEINLKGWSIASGISSSKLTNHPITEDLFVKAGKIFEITREFSKFSLGNLKTKIELRYPDGDVAHDAKYKSEKTIKDGMVYEKKDGGGWEWRENVEDVEDVQIVQDVQNDENAEFVQDGEGGQLERLQRFEQFEQVSDGFGFGFGEEEDALEVVEMLVNELERDIDEIYAEGEVQDAGDVQNVEIVQNVENVQNVQDVEVVQNVQIVFPGASALIVKIEIPGKKDTGTKVVGIENNEYKFTKPLPEEDHYAIKFAKNITSDMNMALNVVMRKLQN